MRRKPYLTFPILAGLSSPVKEANLEVSVTIESKQLSKEELRALIQAIRDCEQKSFPDKEIYIWIEAPELTMDEASEILTSIKPPYRYGPVQFRRKSDA